MKISEEGLRRLIELEGSKKKVYKDSAGYPTIGVGHLLTAEELSSGKILIGSEQVDYLSGITEEQMSNLLRQDLASKEECVSNTIHQPLNTEQFDCLVSFCFNVGVYAFRSSTLVKVLNSGDYKGIPEQLRRWVYANKVKSQGLVNRREAEVEIWNLGTIADHLDRKREEEKETIHNIQLSFNSRTNKFKVVE